MSVELSELQAERGPLTFSPDSTIAPRVVPAHRCGIRANARGVLIERTPTQITHVVIHMLQGHYANAIDRWRSGRACYKPHYVVRNTGDITQVVAERYIALHANRANAYSIGIEHDGFANDPIHLTDAMYVSSAALTRDICRRYGIPVDRTRIIGHDEAPGTSHGDPGGYWDWDYYLALVGWDGSAARRPIRIVQDYSSYSFWPTSSAWRTVRRIPARHAPHPEQSWGSQYYRAAPSPSANEPAVYTIDIPADGTYEIAAWWPIATSNNGEVTLRVVVGSSPTPAIVQRVNQRTRSGRVRRTLALPNTPMWFPLGSLGLTAGDRVTVEISRQSPARGWVIADAIRLLRR